MKNQGRVAGTPKFIRGLPTDDGQDRGDTWLPLLAERLFAAGLKHHREARGMTQAALARAMTLRDVPLSQSAIAKLEREDDAARRPLRLVEAVALATFLGTTVEAMTTTVVPTSDEHAALLAAQRRESDALHEVVAAQQALADAQALASEASVAREAAEAAMKG